MWISATVFPNPTTQYTLTSSGTSFLGVDCHGFQCDYGQLAHGHHLAQRGQDCYPKSGDGAGRGNANGGEQPAERGKLGYGVEQCVPRVPFALVCIPG